MPDRTTDQPVTVDGLLASFSSSQEALTFTCAPPGNGTRFGINRHGDGVLDND